MAESAANRQAARAAEAERDWRAECARLQRYRAALPVILPAVIGTCVLLIKLLFWLRGTVLSGIPIIGWFLFALPWLWGSILAILTILLAVWLASEPSAKRLRLARLHGRLRHEQRVLEAIRGLPADSDLQAECIADAQTAGLIVGTDDDLQEWTEEPLAVPDVQLLGALHGGIVAAMARLADRPLDEARQEFFQRAGQARRYCKIGRNHVFDGRRLLAAIVAGELTASTAGAFTEATARLMSVPGGSDFEAGLTFDGLSELLRLCPVRSDADAAEAVALRRRMQAQWRAEGEERERQIADDARRAEERAVRERLEADELQRQQRREARLQQLAAEWHCSLDEARRRDFERSLDLAPPLPPEVRWPKVVWSPASPDGREWVGRTGGADNAEDDG